MNTGSTPLKPPIDRPRESNELDRIRVGINALCGTGNMIVGVLLLLFTEKPEYEPHVAGMIGIAFVLVGLVQKLVATNERYHIGVK
jgi:hypothetical protein